MTILDHDTALSILSDPPLQENVPHQTDDPTNETHVRWAIEHLQFRGAVEHTAKPLARALLHLHFDTGINLNYFPEALDWVKSIIIDGYRLRLHGDW